MNICIHTISHLTKVPRTKEPVVLSYGSAPRSRGNLAISCGSSRGLPNTKELVIVCCSS